MYDVIGSEYSYTYQQFLNEITPRLAVRMIEIIEIRRNNDYCMAGTLHGLDLSKYFIKPTTPAGEQKLTRAQINHLDRLAMKDLKGGPGNVKK